MKNKLTLLLILVLSITMKPEVSGQEKSLEKYLLDFNYESRAEMKIDSEQLKDLLIKDKVHLIDIRFIEEYNSWNMPFATHIPLSELPSRLDELDKSKIIVTACPHKDRATIAMVYLQTKGYNVKYLTDGLVLLAESLRGDNAYNFQNKI